tara:strand:- start:2202 stop:2627 length:426 start_codon:yes stop_codon:yes gene_type:complete
MDEQEILDVAIENSKNNSIIKLNSYKIAKFKEKILVDLDLSETERDVFLEKLINYRLVDEIPDLELGNYVRWISVKEGVDEIKLTNGGYILSIEIEETGVHIKCKNNMNRIFQIILHENIVFQKLTKEEELLLKVLDYLET